MQFKDVFTKKFLFDINPVMLENADKLLGFTGVVLVVLAALFKIAAVLAPTPVDKHYRNRFFNVFVSIGLGELVWYGLRYENTRFLGTHFAGILILLIGLAWLAMIVRDMAKNYKQKKETWEKDQVKMKYLPNK